MNAQKSRRFNLQLIQKLNHIRRDNYSCETGEIVRVKENNISEREVKKKGGVGHVMHVQIPTFSLGRTPPGEALEWYNGFAVGLIDSHNQLGILRRSSHANMSGQIRF